MTAFDKSFEEVKNLAEKFHGNHAYYASPTYQEAEVRKDFIDKFFIALGWDVNHDDQHNPYEQEVKVEKGQKQLQATAQKRADYAFYTAPNFKDVRFFVEAKKPAVELKHPDNYFQTIRYGWNAGTSIAVLTDFEQFHIIDCRYKPDLKNVFTGKHKEYRYTDYSDKEKFAEIYWLFSREAVLDNSLKKFTDALPKIKGKKTTAAAKDLAGTIDESFLAYIDNIREELAKAFKKNDESLGSEALTEVVTRTVDRLVFIRFLEDKLIEPNNHVSEWKSWNDFTTDCRRLDVKYNGVVFKEHPLLDKKGFAGAEEKMFLNICKDISNRNSPFDFNYIPIHILGSIYEQFLGKVVVATDHRVRIEEKPEVRKAGGVYYTLKYIVDYIVANTVGKLILDKTPKQIAALRFADIACGSGSFLIGVYECLLDYHKNYYQKKYAGRTEPLDARNEDFGLVEYRDGQWGLTLKLKQDILLNNIYGVDIDRQAVEVTQLSLFLKMLEDETLNSTQVRQGALFSKVLPDLSKNIICGNSLIGTDILTGQLFSFEEEKKLNPMDYETAFPSIMRSGGFDAIVGNPPYVRIQALKETSPASVMHFSKKYISGRSGNYDLYVIFIERGLSLISQNGKMGYIIPNKFFNTDYGENIRSVITKDKYLSKIIDFGHSQIFRDATTYTCLLFLAKEENYEFEYCKITDNENIFDCKFSKLESNNFGSAKWSFASDIDSQIISKLKLDAYLLIELPASISRGSSTGNDKIFVLEKRGEKFFNDLGEEVLIEKGILKKPIYATDFTRYFFKQSSKYYLIFPYVLTDTEAKLMTEKDLQKQFPLAYSYLVNKKSLLKERKQFAEWYGYSAPRSLKLHNEANLVIPLLADHGIFSALPENKSEYTLMASGGFSITLKASSDQNYILGLLNSKLLFWYLTKLSNVFRGGWITCTKQYFSQLPIKKINNKNNGVQESIISLVTQILEAKKQLATSQTEGDKTFLENKCTSLDRQIDSLVYKLYDLTEEEIKIVENQN